MPCCAVFNCINYNRITKGTDIRYHRFPKDPDISKQWIAACKREDKINLKNACVCSTHFEPSCFETTFTFSQQLMNYTPKNSIKLKLGAVPTLNLLRTRSLKRANLERTGRRSKRKRMTYTDDSPVPHTNLNISNEKCSNNDDVIDNSFSGKITKADISDQINKNKINKQQFLELKEKVITLEKEKSDLINKMRDIVNVIRKVRNSNFPDI